MSTLVHYRTENCRESDVVKKSGEGVCDEVIEGLIGDGMRGVLSAEAG